MATINRKLASIRRIKQLLPIHGADMIETAVVDGWAVVVKKGENAVGDLIVYFEIDSFIPTSIAPFLTKEGYEPKEYNGVEFHVFDIFDIDKQQYLLPEDRMWLMDTDYMFLNHTTVVDKGTLRNILQLKDGEDPVQKALVYAEAEGDNPGVMREGVVFKCEDEDFSFKAISNSYLLKKG